MENLHKVRAEILESVSDLTDDQLNQVIEEGSWSIAQVLEHLYLMEENAVRLISHSLTLDEFEAPGTFPLHVVADRTKKINAPEFLMPANNFQTLDELKQKLATSRASLEKISQETSEEDLNQKTFAHRRFGVLTLNQWISLVGYHEQRHVGQIEDVKKALIK
ncbi:DinB family protein [Ureibacillus chungkukjangi]|uniref:Putative damage-inducible protein DinB n=1 Tax=Ureibacillus chungkukjangi TaxID=1202712 RepID=A0A318TRE4_9BACL|nr:DinB family protein [Ureibacillus chungkukjangi]MCM3389638.1 DinB family protein [Ureibacillus chungkukjangi]PYF06400.1 putative damage-inducible protein DinB [Ureibacillus chungkukjangi]